MLGPEGVAAEPWGTAPAGFSRLFPLWDGKRTAWSFKAFYCILLLNMLPVTRAWNDTVPTFMLPTVHMQFVCHQDIRDHFSVEPFFASFYKQAIHIPTEIENATLHLNETRFRHNVLIDSMKDIPPTKRYYRYCNISSPKVLFTMQVEGWVQLHLWKNGTNEAEDFSVASLSFTEDDFMEAMMDKVTPTTLEDFLGGNACTSMELFRAYVDYVPEIHQHNPLDRWSPDNSHSVPPGGKDKSLGYNEDHLQHNLFLLCGGADYVYYDVNDEEDSGFYLFGLMVGMVMAAMIMTELQQYNELPRRRAAAAAAAEARANATTESATGTSDDSNTRRQRRRRSRRTSHRSSRQQGRRGDYAVTSQIELEMV